MNHTALDVVEQYRHARSNGWITKDDRANYNNRWLQFKGGHVGKTLQVVNDVHKRLATTAIHIYANWVKDGHQYGRHNDAMDVAILQTWNSIAYCVESPFGPKQHTAFTLDPGDLIYIRAGVYHTPIIFGERMSMSFSW